MANGGCRRGTPPRPPAPRSRSHRGERLQRDPADRRAARQSWLRSELLDEQAVGAGEHLPVEITRLVARLIGAVLGEFDREPAEWRTVDAGEEPLHDPLRHDLDPTEASDFSGIQQIDALHVSHGSRKVMAGGLSRVEDTGAKVMPVS